MYALEITDALVITGQGADRIYLTTTLVDPIGRNEKLALSFSAPAGTGVEFVQTQIGFPTVCVTERNKK